MPEVALDPLDLIGEALGRMRRLLDFILNMDAREWRAVLVSFLLFGGVGLVFLFGAQIFGFNGETTVEHWMGAANGPWALPVAVAAFAVLAFVGVPQFVLIAAAVVAFGPLTGMAYSWVGTLVSAVIGFGVGRVFGGKVLRDLGGKSVNRFIDLIGRNGFMASMIVRLVPSAPFVVINVAAGVTPMRLRAFVLGTGLGIIPKIVLTAYAGAAALQATRGQGGKHFVVLALAAALWIGAGWAARRWWKARERREAED